MSWLLLPSLNIRSIAGSLHIDLSHRPSVESREISEGVVLDYDASGHVVGIDIDNASVKVELHELMVSKVPFTTHTITG